MEGWVAAGLVGGIIGAWVAASGVLSSPPALRILVKSMTWRAVGTTQVILLSWLLSGSWDKAFAIGVPDTLVKLLLGMLHERLFQTSALAALSYRRLWKAATWKVAAVSSTIIIATMYGNYNFAIKLGPIDTVFKSLNYYLHELVWDQITWGVLPAPRVTAASASNAHGKRDKKKAA
eukprot:m.189967 g.189967  ORF g.189967 m.189967 type:complete len:177 (+) comp15122_c0_seq3:210-740(+)